MCLLQAVDAYDDMVDENSSSQVKNGSQASLVPSSSGKLSVTSSCRCVLCDNAALLLTDTAMASWCA